MATVSKNNASLKLQFDKGLNDEGKAITSSKTFSNLKEGANPDDILEVANSLSSLQQYDLLNVLKIDYSYIS